MLFVSAIRTGRPSRHAGQ